MPRRPSAEARKGKAEKCKTARSLWAPAINNHGGYERCGFLEITDPWDAVGTIGNALTAVPAN